MLSKRLAEVALDRVRGKKATGLWVVVAGAQVIEVQSDVLLLAGEQIVIRARTRVPDGLAEGIVGEGVGDDAAGVGQGPRRAQGIGVVEQLLARLLPGDQAVSVV